MPLDIEFLRKWVGRKEERSDLVTEFPVSGLLSLLDRPGYNFLDKETKIPLASHWLYFLPRYSQSEVGEDGHKIRGGFLPPVELPRRMWAGGRLKFIVPLKLGEQIYRVSTIKQVKHVPGTDGDLIFVLVGHVISNSERVLIEEDHNIVYRAAANGKGMKKKKKLVPGIAQWSKIVKPDPVLLFRYSALTFNSHRIHYDRDYVKNREGYPGLIVHGPLLATLLLDFFESQMPAFNVLVFDYRAVSPIFDVASFSLNGMVTGADTAKLWIADSDGSLAMSADVHFSS